MSKPAPYVTNKQLLAAIHASKNSYCEYIDQKYANYDVIVEDLNEITPDIMTLALINRKKRLKTPVVLRNEIVYRVLTAEHVPLDPDRKNKTNSRNPDHTRTNFYPFKHYIIEEGKFVEVGRSHSLNGEFCQDHGNLTEDLAIALMLMVEKYAMKNNWNRYTYLNEMKSEAIVQLTQNALMFQEGRTGRSGQENPFAYYTSCMKNSFVKILNLEKKHRDIRDDLLQECGLNASSTRQLDHEHEHALKRQDW